MVISMIVKLRKILGIWEGVRKNINRKVGLGVDSRRMGLKVGKSGSGKTILGSIA